MIRMEIDRTRRDFVSGMTAFGAASLLGIPTASAMPPPEVGTIRLTFDPEIEVLCFAPQYVAKQFLHMEGFDDVQYVPFGKNGGQTQTLVAGEADITAEAITDWVGWIDRKKPLHVLAGLHQGCFEIVGNENVKSIRDLQGRRVAAVAKGNGDQLLVASVAAYIGIDPMRDIEWVYSNPADWARMLAQGEVDAIGTFPPMNYDIRAKNLGHVLVNTTTDYPWRDYFCCMVGARSEFVERYPIATKRALRAFLKANDLCSQDPQGTAKWLVQQGFASQLEYTKQTLQDTPYNVWRTFNPEDTFRFFALRLYDLGMVKTPPNELIARGTDWRFLDEIKRELKA